MSFKIGRNKVVVIASCNYVASQEQTSCKQYYHVISFLTPYTVPTLNY